MVLIDYSLEYDKASKRACKTGIMEIYGERLIEKSSLKHHS
jgi:hypothetical protein